MIEAGDVVLVNNYLALAISLLGTALLSWFLWIQFNRVEDKWMTKRKRRRAHLRYVSATIFELKYKIVNLALSCERGDISLTAFNRRTLNAARLIRRYETKRSHLNRLVK